MFIDLAAPQGVAHRETRYPITEKQQELLAQSWTKII